MQTISILATGDGWLLRCDEFMDQIFRSGASAESAAIRLAQGHAEAGRESEVLIYSRDGTLAKRFTVPPLRID